MLFMFIKWKAVTLGGRDCGTEGGTQSVLVTKDLDGVDTAAGHFLLKHGKLL
jgi:hypothetical protein